jgi:hypothetical protein
MTRAFPILFLSLPLVACTGAIEAGSPGRSPSGASGAGVVGAGAAGTDVVRTGAGGTGVVGSTGTGGTDGGTSGAGSAGVAGSQAGAAGSQTGAAGAPACGPGAIPADVAAVISARCIACHGTPPLQGVPSSLGTYASLTAPSKTDPTKSVAAVAVARLQPGAAMPMPPPPLTGPTPAEAAAFAAWVSAGTPPAACADGGAPLDGGGGIVDPYATPVVCTSKSMWTRGNSGSHSMDPGQACIACHSMTGGEAPLFALGGTVYPTAHEPDNCNGGAVAAMARVEITGADKKVVTLTPDASGNFSYQGALAKPYTAKVTYMGRERAMIAAQSSGDCNACHTQAGAMMAPGRIMLP